MFAKGKHIKQLTKAFKKSPKTKVKTQKAKSQGVRSSKNTNRTSMQIKGKEFTSIREAETHFRNMGIDTDLSKCTDIRQLIQLDAELAKLKAMGIESQIKSITITPFDNHSLVEKARLKGIENSIRETIRENGGNIFWAYGCSHAGHIFMNPNGFRRMANGSDVIKHEIGHYHRNVLKDNFYGTAENANEMYVCAIKNIAQKTNMTKEQVVDKLTSKLHSEVKAYSHDADENFADMFSLMIDGKQYSKGAMLFYDMAGGGRIPNKVINGMKYDDYICNLYEDAENILMNYIK